MLIGWEGVKNTARSLECESAWNRSITQEFTELAARAARFTAAAAAGAVSSPGEAVKSFAFFVNLFP